MNNRMNSKTNRRTNRKTHTTSDSCTLRAGRSEVMLVALAGFALAWLAAPAPQSLPAREDDPSSETVEPQEVREGGHTFWLYHPPQRPARALIVVPPAGGTLLTAAGLGPGDRAEHFPYLAADFAVVAFTVSGELSGRVTREDALRAIRDFAGSRAGVQDARAAIDVAIATWPYLGDLPIFAAGHSSAANLVLALATEDPRIRGVAAYAPAADAVAFIDGNLLERLAREVPGALELASELSPIRLAERLRVPTLLFHAQDDEITSIEATRRLAGKLRDHGARVELVTVASGGHYDAMLSEGIPAAIRWFEQLLSQAEPRSPPASARRLSRIPG